MLSVRFRYTLITSFALLFIFFSKHFYRSRSDFSLTPGTDPSKPILEDVRDHDPAEPSLTSTPPPPGPKYKPQPTESAIPIVDNFPLAASAHSASELPPIPSWNTPPSPHVKEITPLFIGFTRNWRVLQQVVVSYITSGWPAEDIYVVENTGVMDSNQLGLLSLQNPFFLNHTRLEMLGVNVLVTPTLFTFAQLQNFYLFTATERSWAHYFWSHMDVVVVSLEEKRFPKETPGSPPPTNEPWELNTLYTNCVLALRNVTTPAPAISPNGLPATKPWANVFFSYDRLALVNVAAYKSIGAWDTLIPFYMTDCDMHSRITMADYEIYEWRAGLDYDVASSVDDVLVYYRVDEGPTGKVQEVGWKDPNPPEEEEKKEGKRKREEEVKGEEIEHQARELAALFTPHSPSSSSPSSPSPHPHPQPNTTLSPLWHHDTPSSPAYAALTSTLDRMQHSKVTSKAGRNTWQSRQSGGQGEPFYRDAAGFETGILMTIEHGRAVYREKWGHRDCDIYQVGLRAGDAWRVEKDWE